VVCRSVCLLVTFVSPAKTAEPIEMSFEDLAYVGPRNPVLDGSRGRTNLLAAAGSEKSTMRPFAKLLWAFVLFFPGYCSASLSVSTPIKGHR